MDLSEDELIMTKLDNKSMSIYQLLNHWHIKYGVPQTQIKYAKEYIKKLEGKNEQ